MHECCLTFRKPVQGQSIINEARVSFKILYIIRQKVRDSMKKKAKECYRRGCSHREAHKTTVVNMTNRSREIESTDFSAHSTSRVYFWRSLRGELKGKRRHLMENHWITWCVGIVWSSHDFIDSSFVTSWHHRHSSCCSSLYPQVRSSLSQCVKINLKVFHKFEEHSSHTIHRVEMF